MPCINFKKVKFDEEKNPVEFKKSNNGKLIEFKLDGIDTTLINPIMDMLDKDENVKIVRYVNIHPELENPLLIVEVREDSPVTAAEAISNAANKVSDYFATVNKTGITQ